MVEISLVREEWWAVAELADAIVFDLDGTLVDSDVANFLAYKAAVSYVLPCQMRNIEFYPGIRMTREVLVKHLPNASNEQIARIISKKNLLYKEYLPRTKLNIFLASIIEQSRGKEMVLATNSQKSRADMLLD